MRAIGGTPHIATREISNLMMLKRELRLPDQLLCTSLPTEATTRHQCVVEARERLEAAHSALQEKQVQVRQEDDEAPPLFAPGDLVWLENRRKKKGENPKLQPKFVGPYHVLEACGKHTYKLERQGQTSTQHETRLKPYRPCPEAAGQAPTRLEPSRRPNMKGAVSRRKIAAPHQEPQFAPPLLLPENENSAEIEPKLQRTVKISLKTKIIMNCLPNRQTTPKLLAIDHLEGPRGRDNSPLVLEMFFAMYWSKASCPTPIPVPAPQTATAVPAALPTALLPPALERKSRNQLETTRRPSVSLLPLSLKGCQSRPNGYQKKLQLPSELV